MEEVTKCKFLVLDSPALLSSRHKNSPSSSKTTILIQQAWRQILHKVMHQRLQQASLPTTWFPNMNLSAYRHPVAFKAVAATWNYCKFNIGGKRPLLKKKKPQMPLGPFWSFVNIKKKTYFHQYSSWKDGSLIHYEHSSHHIKHQEVRNKEEKKTKTKVLKLWFTSLYTIS